MADTSAYVPPIDDYAFLFAEAFGTDVVARATDGALSAEDAVDALSAAGELAAEVLAPLNASGDREGVTVVDGQAKTPTGFPEAYRAIVDAGWVTAEAPESAGGDGLPALVQAGLGEMWNAANTSFALCSALNTGAIHALDAYASDDLREQYLTRLVSGEWTGTMNLTEPHAGSDVGALTSKAEPI